MGKYTYEKRKGGRIAILVSDDGVEVRVIATATSEQEAKQIVAALNLAEAMPQRFPGLADGETEVDGGDLVEFLGYWGWGEDGQIFERD